jgi:hypothetical protein
MLDVTESHSNPHPLNGKYSTNLGNTSEVLSSVSSVITIFIGQNLMEVQNGYCHLWQKTPDKIFFII